MQTTTRNLLTATEVQALLDIDRSTVYRMAGDGRLPAVRVGRQWRFPADDIERMFDFDAGPVDSAIDPVGARSILEAVAPTLGVMMVVTDLDGIPVTPVVNPTAWMRRQPDSDAVVEECLDEWRLLASALDLSPRFVQAPPGFECAGAFVRSGAELVGMVLAGGLAPAEAKESDFVVLDAAARAGVLEALPRVGALISQFGVNNNQRSNS